MRLTLALFLLVSLAACGGSSKPAAAPADPPPAEASCCCDYIKEEGDPEGDNWSENQTFEMMDAQGCTDLSGQCVDASSCSGEAADGPPV